MGSPSIIAPGRNCWRRCAASRLAALIGADAYYAAFAEAARAAKHSILIIGWDVSSHLELGGAASQLGPFLDGLCRTNPSLHVHALAWDFALVFDDDRESEKQAHGSNARSHGHGHGSQQSSRRIHRRSHRRVHLEHDDHHPAGASHHQKIVVIDDRVAFVGGLDLSEPRNGAQFHDVQLMLEGEAARALGDLARERWWRATGRRLTAPSAVSSAWPTHVQADAINVELAIARTEGPHDDRESVFEIERLHIDAIASAVSSIYIETQYLTSRTVTEALVKRLKQADGPEMVIVVPQHAGGWLDAETMAVLRGRVIEILRHADDHRRLAIVSPLAHAGSKVMIVDDSFARVGSANLSNRSMGLDSECDVAWEATRPELTTAIAELRRRLVAAHLGVSVETYAEAERKRGLRTAVTELGGARLRALQVASWETSEEIVPRERLIDPVSAVDVDLILETLVPSDAARSQRLAFYRMALVVAVLVGLTALWRFSPLHAYLDPRRLAELAMPLRDAPWAWAAAIGAYVLAGLLSFPLVLLVLQSGLVFGASVGIPVAFVGAMLSAASTFGIGRLIGRGFVGKVSGKRLRLVMQRLRRSGVLSVVLVRILPIAPFSILNVIAGASGVRFTRFMLGSLIGMAPGVIGINLFGASLFEAMATRDPWRLVTSVGIGALLVLTGVWLRRRLARRGRVVTTAEARAEAEGAV